MGHDFSYALVDFTGGIQMKSGVNLGSEMSNSQLEEGGAIPSHRSFFIKEIEKKLAFDMIIKNHYSHKKSMTRFALGLYLNETLVGCMTYGFPVGRLVPTSICPMINKDNLLELTRLWVDDCCGKNTESWFISQSFKWLKENHSEIKCLISYADQNYNHKGIIYQATNWFYQKSPMRFKQAYELEIGGKRYHSRTCNAKFGTNNIQELKQITGQEVRWIPLEKKHRYLYFLGNKKEKKEFLKTLKHPLVAYPK